MASNKVSATISTAKKSHKAILVLGFKDYRSQIIEGEIPAQITYGAKTLRLKMVLWYCERRDPNSDQTFLKLKALIYK